MPEAIHVKSNIVENMDQLMSSLLVYKDGQLMPASSASSSQFEPEHEVKRENDVDAPLQGDRVINAPVGGTTAACMSEMASSSNPFRIKNVDSSGSTASHRPFKRRHVEEVAKKLRNAPQTSSSPPCTADAAQQSELSHGTAEQPAVFQPGSIPPPSNQLRQHRMDVQDVSMGNNMPALATSGLISVEDFEKQNPFVPRLPRNGLPPRTVDPIRLEVNDGTYTSMLHAACQERGLSPIFDIPQVAEGCFRAVLVIDNKIIGELADVYASKRDAKEELSRRALPAVLALDNKKKRKSLESDANTAPDGLDEEEWMGILMQYAQTKKSQRPVVNTEGVHIIHGPFYSTIKLPDDSLALFGVGMGPFKQKKIAEKVAAREAVLWLRAQGRLDPNAEFHNPGKDIKPSKRRKSTDSEHMVEGETGLTQALAPGLALNRHDQMLDEDSPGKAAHHLAVSLGFQTPQIRQLSVSDSAFVDTWAEFELRDVRIEPRLAGQIGKVEHVFGKKSAKEMCWREVLKVLGEIRESRLRPH